MTIAEGIKEKISDVRLKQHSMLVDRGVAGLVSRQLGMGEVPSDGLWIVRKQSPLVIPDKEVSSYPRLALDLDLFGSVLGDPRGGVLAVEYLPTRVKPENTDAGIYRYVASRVPLGGIIEVARVADDVTQADAELVDELAMQLEMVSDNLGLTSELVAPVPFEVEGEIYLK